MDGDTVRVVLSLAPGTDPGQVLRELEERLGHPAERPLWLRGVRVLALRLGKGELDLARQIDGVLDAQEEHPTELPRPVRPRLEER